MIYWWKYKFFHFTHTDLVFKMKRTCLWEDFAVLEDHRMKAKVKENKKKKKIDI